MGKSKQKRRFTREPHLPENTISARKRAKQDVFHRMVVISLERKTGGDIYGNVIKNINDAIAVIPRMIEDSLKCSARIHKQKISNNQLLDKEEAETY